MIAVPAKLTRETLDSLASQNGESSGSVIRVGMSSCGIAAGAQQVFDLLRAQVLQLGLDARVEQCGCSGMCYAEPLVEVSVEGRPTMLYGNVTPELAVRILDEHVREGRVLNDLAYDVPLRED